MKKRPTLFLAAITLGIFTSACKNDKVDCATFQWGYSYTNGPEYWGQCESNCNGKHQSPINIEGAETDASLSTLQIAYNATPIDIKHNGHAIELTYEAGSVLSWEGKGYTLKQAHFHGGSEHTVEGERYELEMHLVHQNDDVPENKTVIGIFVAEGTENAFLNQFFDNLPLIENEHYTDTTRINIADFFPTSGGYYTYSGSLTTPPCTESVNWIVMKEPVQASAQQIERLRSILHITYRPVQKLNKRKIREFH